MRKNIIITSLAFMATGLLAQPNSDMQIPRNILKFSPQHLIRGGLWMSGEIINKDLKKAHQLSVEVMYRQPNERYTGVIKGVGFTAEYQYKYYVNRFHIEKSLTGKQSANGYYVGFFGQYGQYNERSRYIVYQQNAPYNGEERTNDVNTTSIYPGFVIGLQKSIGESFYIDFYAGAGMRASNSTIKTKDDSFNYRQSPGAYFIYNNGLLPKVGMSLGVGF